MQPLLRFTEGKLYVYKDKRKGICLDGIPLCQGDIFLFISKSYIDDFHYKLQVLLKGKVCNVRIGFELFQFLLDTMELLE